MSRLVPADYVPIPVLLLDIQRPELAVPGPQKSDRAMVFLRFRDCVVGSALLPVIGARLSPSDLNDAIRACRPAMKAHLETRPTKHRPDVQHVSIVVCTRDRPFLLRECLLSLLKLRQSPGEILVVDSAPSTEETLLLTREFPSVRYVRSGRPGLNVARNRGIREARGDFVAFLDDDARADPDWLACMVEEFAHPMTAVVCGITLPAELETEAQWDFEQHVGFGRGFLRRTYSIESFNILGTGAVGAGVNMAICREKLDDSGLFDEALDGGTPTESGGDQEFFYRVLARGQQIVYNPAAMVWHRHRRTLPEAAKVVGGYGTGVFAWWTKCLVVDHEFSLLLHAPLWFVRHHLWRLTKSIMHLHGAPPPLFALAEAAGALSGPLAYARSRWFDPAP